MTNLALSVKSAAAEVDSAEGLIRTAINKGELPAYRVGRFIRIDRDDLREWLRSRPRVGSDEDTT